MRRLTLALLGLALCVNQSLAFIQSQNQRLDHAIWPKHDPKLIVAGTIDAIQTNALNLFPPQISFALSVQDVIFGSQEHKGSTLTIPVSSFSWPTNLVQFTIGTRCILVLRTDWGETHDGFYIYTVVPRSTNALSVASSGDGAKRILEKEILAELKTETLPERQEALLIQVAPILTRERAPQVVTFLKSRNFWVVRAAQAALVYSTEKEEYVRQMAKDVQSFFDTTKPKDLIKEQYAPYPYFFDHYFFLEKRSWTWGSRWDESEADKHLRILNAMFDTGIISDKVKKILNPEQAESTVPVKAAPSASSTVR